MRVTSCALIVGLSACADPDEDAFRFVGEVADFPGNGSTIGLFDIPGMTAFYKFGDGSTVFNQFDLAFETEPPIEALDAGGFGVAYVGLLPGLATVPEGPVDPGLIALRGISENHAIIFKTPGATGPEWLDGFPDGFTCAQCVRPGTALETFEPVGCTFVVAQAFAQTVCNWY